MQNYFALSAPQITNAGVDTTPIANALNDYRLRQRQAEQDALAAEERQYQRSRNSRQDTIADEQRKYERDNALKERLAKRAMAYDQLTDPIQRQEGLQSILREHPNAANLPDAYKNPTTAFKLIAADYGQFRDDLDRQLKQAQIGKYEAEAAKDRQSVLDAKTEMEIAKGMMPNAIPNTPQQQNNLGTQAQLSNISDQPTTNNQTTNNNSMSLLTDDQRRQAAAAYVRKDYKTYNEIIDKATSRANAAKNIQGGLEYLKNIADKYDDTAFENALGRWAGTDPDYSNAWAVNLARLWGELGNEGKDAEGKTANLAKLRDDIFQGQSALAQLIKPLVRVSGEGTFDQREFQNLLNIVGNFAQSKSKPEFLQRLNETADRIRMNYQIPINFKADIPNDVLVNEIDKQFPKQR